VHFPAGRAVLDTCVLYPAMIRDTLLSLAEAELYQPVWSDQILQELIDNLNDRKPPPNVARLLDQMAVTFDDSCLDGYQHLVPEMTCDKKDRHVLALAVHVQAETLVTSNLDDFPAASVDPFQVSVLSPDDFALDLFSIAPAVVTGALREQAARYGRPPRTLVELVQSLKHPQKLPRFAVEVCRYLGRVGGY